MQNDIKFRVCNSINCFYTNEYLGLDDENIAEFPNECKLCSYNFNKLFRTHNFLKHELNHSSKQLNNQIRQKIYEIILKTFAVMSGVAILVYFISYFKFLSE